jgi:hypothetical protein
MPILVFIIILVLVAGLVLWQRETIAALTGPAQAVFYLIISLLPAVLLFGIFRTVAHATGKLYGMTIEVGGPAGLFIIVLILLLNLPGKPPRQTAPSTPSNTTSTTTTTTTATSTTTTGTAIGHQGRPPQPPQPPPPHTWHVPEDFPTPFHNPQGRWSFGYTNNNAYSFTPYQTEARPSPTVSTYVAYTANLDGSNNPNVGLNTSAATITPFPGITLPPNMVHLHPGPHGERSILRFTAPTTGTYTINGVWDGLNANTTSDVTIYETGCGNGTVTLFPTSYINGFTTSMTPIPPQGYAFAIGPVQLCQHGTIDFVVGWGNNNTYNSDSTGLHAVIDRQ